MQFPKLTTLNKMFKASSSTVEHINIKKENDMYPIENRGYIKENCYPRIKKTCKTVTVQDGEKAGDEDDKYDWIQCLFIL